MRVRLLVLFTGILEAFFAPCFILNGAFPAGFRESVLSFGFFFLIFPIVGKNFGTCKTFKRNLLTAFGLAGGPVNEHGIT